VPPSSLHVTFWEPRICTVELPEGGTLLWAARPH
jgi:hypothetical protein